MRAIEVRDISQVAEARRVAVQLAGKHGFDEEDAGRVAIVVSELATNLVKHGGGGELLLSSFEDRSGAGIECIALDKGPGMADISASMRDGHSTAGSAGTGLGAVRRGSHLSAIYSGPGRGTAILARMCVGSPEAPKATQLPMSIYGAVSVPLRGEDTCGDGWCFRKSPDGLHMMVADGLGHGPLAADASHAASRVFVSHYAEAPGVMLKRMEVPAHSTRGAAVAVASLTFSDHVLVFAGVGNIAGVIIAANGANQRMVSHNGTIGHIVKRIQEFRYPVERPALIILSSDGLGTSWSLDSYPGLMTCHPALIAAVLYRDFTRGRDDVTVLVVRVD